MKGGFASFASFAFPPSDKKNEREEIRKEDRQHLHRLFL